MKPKGIKSVFQNANGNYIAVCKDGSVWIAQDISALGKAHWYRVDPVPKRDL